MKSVLDGIRVLELATYHVGPMAGVMLSDLGAEVIKVEDIQTGDVVRGLKTLVGIPVMTPKGSASYVGANRGKKDVVIDLKQPEGREIVYRMLPKCDVFLTSFRRPALHRLGMDYETLKRHNPRLIYAHASAYGSRGPDADLPGTDFVGQARGGTMRLQRNAEDEPSAPYGLADQMGAISTAYGTLAALLARERLGIGQEVSSSILGGVVWLETLILIVTLATGREFPAHHRLDVGDPLVNTYRAGDGKWFALCMGLGSDMWWPRVCKAIERPDLEHDPRFHDVDTRNQNHRELIAIFDEVFLRRDQAEWLRRFAECDCQASAVNQLTDLTSDIQVMLNEYITEHDDPILGKQKVVGFPVTLGETPMRIASPAPLYGEHTEEVLQQVGGYSWEEILRLKGSRVIL